nr:uncharacterized protein LOC113825077 [Penaeus vannamei]
MSSVLTGGRLLILRLVSRPPSSLEDDLSRKGNSRPQTTIGPVSVAGESSISSILLYVFKGERVCSVSSFLRPLSRQGSSSSWSGCDGFRKTVVALCKSQLLDRSQEVGHSLRGTGNYYTKNTNFAEASPSLRAPSNFKINRKTLANTTMVPKTRNLKHRRLFSLLGREFVEQHFPLQKFDVSILEPPRTNPKNKEKYMSEMREFLQNALNQAMSDCDYPDDVSSYQEDDELGHFLHEVRTSFREGLRKHTAIVMFEEEAEKQRQKEEKRKRNAGNDGGGGGGDFGYGFDTDEGNDTDDELELARRRAQKMNAGTKPSDIAGRALVAFIAHDEALKWKYMERIRERHLGLPPVLRRFFWWEFLKEKEAVKLKPKPEDDLKELVKRNFDKTLAKEMKAQGVDRAIRSNNWKVIDHAVIENYDNTACLATLDTDEHMIQTTRTLNILDVHSKQFSVAQIYWLIPLQFAAEHGENEETGLYTT